MGVTRVTKTKTLDSVQACSVLHVAHAGVRRVTVVIVHVGHEDVLVVIQFCVAIFVRDLLYYEMYSLHKHKCGGCHLQQTSGPATASLLRLSARWRC